MTTDLEQRVERSLAQTLELAAVPQHDMEAAVRAGERLRRRSRRSVVAALVIAVVVTGIGGSVLREPRTPPPAPAADAGGWRRLPDLPKLASMPAPTMIVHTGRDVIVSGGWSSCATAEGDECEAPLSTSAVAYDVETDAWRQIADLPFQPQREMVIDGTLVVTHDGRSVAYDRAADAWRPLPEAPVANWWFAESAGSVGYAIAEDHTILRLDLATDSWSALPTAGLDADFALQDVFATDEGLLAVGAYWKDGVEYPDGVPTSPLVSYRLEGDAWRLLSEIDQDTAGWRSWTGERLLVGPSSRGFGYIAVDVDNGTTVQLPGGWPDDPDEPMPYADPLLPADAVAGPLAFSAGLVYDDRTGSYTPLERPEGVAFVVRDFVEPVSLPGGGRPGPAVWADGALYMLGVPEHVDPPDGTAAVDASSEVWVWTP
jgi:hypothetical protein